MIETSLVDILFLKQSHLQSNLATLAYGLDIHNPLVVVKALKQVGNIEFQDS